jgi:hypothetical protein
MDRRQFLADSFGAALLTALPADLLAQPARAPQSGNWDAGRVRPLLPAASDTRFLIKASFTQPLASTPALRIGNRSATGRMTETAGEFWQFFVDGLLPGEALPALTARVGHVALRAVGGRVKTCERAAVLEEAIWPVHLLSAEHCSSVAH